MNFSRHPNFDRDIKRFLKKHHQDDGWVFNLQNLLTGHFEKKTVRLNVDVLAQVGKLKEFELWKVYMAVGGIHKKQRPRVCFSKLEMNIIFLCFGTHIENYTTLELIRMGKQRLEEIIVFSQNGNDGSSA